MTDHDALLRVVLLAPGDDAPRLIYADWLDEHGQPERAEFVRVQCELTRFSRWPCGGYYCDEAIGHVDCEDPTGDKAVALRKRDQELWPHVVPTFDVPADWLVDVHRRGTDRSAVVRRGFLDEIRLPLAAFVGGPCGRCDGGWVTTRVRHGPDAGDDEESYSSHRCDNCSGTGRADGLAGRLFAAHPVTRVVISDAVIFPSGGNDTYYVGSLGVFPSKYWGRLENHRSRSAAAAALNDVCVAYGRSRAGLPPLSPSPSPPS